MIQRLGILLTVICVFFFASCSTEDEIEQFKLSTSTLPVEGGTISPTQDNFDSGEEIELTATPSKGYQFKNWSGDITGSFNPYILRITSDMKISAIFEKQDDDNDGVDNEVDMCSDTPLGQTVDDNGCSDGQLDADEDGVNDNTDECPNTSKGEAVDEKGCSESQNDSDGDGITNNIDQCSDTSDGETTDAQGCSDSQKDSDDDGVTDCLDQCPDTPKEDSVDSEGCTIVQLTYVPDDAFEQYLIDQGYDDVLDDYVITDNIKTVQQVGLGDSPDGFSYRVSDLTGLEDFESLTKLQIENAQLAIFEIEKYESLLHLSFFRSTLESPLLINNSNLISLGIDIIAPEAIIINNEKLKNIRVFDFAKFMNLEISNNPSIEDLQTTLEDLTVENLIVSNNRSLKNFFCVFCRIDNVSFSNNNNLMSISLDVNTDLVKTYEVINNQNLINLNLSGFTNLSTLNLENSSLIALDVSENNALTTLNAVGSPLSCIEVNQNQLDNIPVGWSKDQDDIYSLDCP